MKNGNATGDTIGRATGIFSYVREYFNDSTHQTSMEWAILPYDNNLGLLYPSATASVASVAPSLAVPAGKVQIPQTSRKRRPTHLSRRNAHLYLAVA